MVWRGDDIKIKDRYKSRQNTKSPFPSIEMEEDFVVRARIMLERYYVDDPKSKSNMYFEKDKHISKSRFWSVLLVYYHYEMGMKANFYGYSKVLKKNFEPKHACDHKSIRNCYLSLDSLNIHHKHTQCSDESRQEEQKINRQMYHDIIEIWKSLV